MKPLIIIAITTVPLSIEAATVAYVNSAVGTEVNEWRTTSTTKTYDIDGDNRYGTYGAVQWVIGSTGETTAGSTSPGWANIGGAGSQYSGYTTQLDRITTGTVGASIKLTNFTFEMTGNSTTYTGMTLRIGIMADMLNSVEWAADQNKGFQIEQILGGTGNSGVISLRSGGAGDGTPEMYFFDLTDVNPGDRFRINALNNVSGAGVTQPGYLGPVSFDLFTTVPEPSSALFGAIGFFALLKRKRS